MNPLSRLLPKLLTLALATTLAARALVSVPLDDPRLQYTGRIDATNPAAPELSWSGSSLLLRFRGTSLSLTLEDQYGNNHYNVFVDGDYSAPRTLLHCAKGRATYAAAEGLSPGEHTLLITKRTEGGDGATRFVSLELSDGAVLLDPPPRPSRRIEIYGDSISSGMGNESPDDGVDHESKDKNNFMAYGPIAARQLNAELHVISQSGIGIMISWFDFIMPRFYDQLNAVGDNDSKWDFSKWTPDVVVINLFQNDCWLVDREKRLQPIPTDEQRVQAYVDFVRSIRAKYPKAQFICALGSMDATRTGSRWPGYISTAVERMKTEFHDDKIDTLFFDFTGFEKHPRVRHHQANADKLSAFIRQKMGW